MDTQRQSQIWARFWELIEASKRYLADYEKLVAKSELSRELPYAEYAYLEAIIIRMAQIFSSSKNDKFSIDYFKSICSDEVKKELEEMQKKYKNTIGKIITNRNKLIAHMDKNFPDFFSFSEKEKERMAQDWRARPDLAESSDIFLRMPTAIDKSHERYSSRDFQDDVPQLKEILKELMDAWNHCVITEKQ